MIHILKQPEPTRKRTGLGRFRSLITVAYHDARGRRWSGTMVQAPTPLGRRAC